jgi:signal peptide peptidase SppA
MSDLDTLVIRTVGQTWAIDEAVLWELRRHEGREFTARRLSSGSQPGPDLRHGSVSVVPLHGVITPRTSLLGMLFGGGDASLSTFKSNMTAALNDPDSSAIVLDIDSPGGLVDGVPEAAEWLRQARNAGKPIVAVSNHQMASAAYWLSSQAHEIVASPSAQVGSIGVYTTHHDLSEAAKKEGVATTVISAGRFKAEGHPFAPLGDEATAHLQQGVDDLYGMFTQAVAQGRSRASQTVTADDVRNGYGQGRMLIAKRAVAAGLADRVGTLEETVNRLQDGAGSRVARTDADRMAFDPAAAVALSPSQPIRAADAPTDLDRQRRLADALRELG